MTGVTMDKVVNWFLLLIVFVFDPLAIALVVTANFAFSRITTKDEMEDLGLDMSGMNRLEKVETLNGEVANGLRKIKDFEDKINSVSGILNNIRNKVKGKK